MESYDPTTHKPAQVEEPTPWRMPAIVVTGLAGAVCLAAAGMLHSPFYGALAFVFVLVFGWLAWNPLTTSRTVYIPLTPQERTERAQRREALSRVVNASTAALEAYLNVEEPLLIEPAWASLSSWRAYDCWPDSLIAGIAVEATVTAHRDGRTVSEIVSTNPHTGAIYAAEMAPLTRERFAMVRSEAIGDVDLAVARLASKLGIVTGNVPPKGTR